MDITIYNEANQISPSKQQEVHQFLFTHLEQYGDEQGAINKCIDYAMKKNKAPGGAVFTAKIENEMVGAVVMNKTGMSEYIPENILVYIATHGGHRGKGIGRNLMTHAIENTEGDIALHVEKDNPARFLYEKLGFKTPYLEMRLKK